MKKLFLFSLLCYLTKAEYNVKCSDNLHSGLTFEATNDGVEGRYRVEWCTMADKNVTNWELVMRYYDTLSPSRCEKYSVDIPLGLLHSRFNEIVHVNLNCTNVCFSTNLDLIFNSTCYHIKTVLHRGTTSSSPHDSLHYVNNPYPKEHFTKSMALVRTHSTYEELIMHWYLGFVPATDYTMNLCTADFQWCVDVGGNCSTLGECRCEVRCVLRVPDGCYSARLKQLAPWTEALRLFGSQALTEHPVCHYNPPPTPADVSRAALWWLCAGAALAALALALLLRAHRARLAAALRARVLRHWLDRTEAEAAKPINGSEADERRVLLLYARDCPALARVAGALRRLLGAAGCAVLDPYSAAAARAAARAPAAWLQRALAADGARVVLLQSAGAAAAARAPLVHARAPHAADALLALALRRLAETGHVGLPYRKYFVAEVAGLEADVLPHLTRLRRYSLPAAAELLLRDVAGPDAPAVPVAPEVLAELSQATDELLQFVRENPDYMSDMIHIC
ncbi:uncharacterized protein LOC126771418 [Nymphalis io]|uniref:uncharacterized protein LOC126771418 n=1 Tax=Inachis io TaxID=171585 RepID=UPI002167F957|nr:uncharacterized protein LOC126771418 [Nymphalis io]